VTALHSKVVAIDDKVAYVGSANLNSNGLEYNWELTLKTTNPNSIREAKEYILTGFLDGTKKQDLTEYYYETFANGPEYLNMVLKSIRNASSVKILNFELTYSFHNATAPDSRMMHEVRDAFFRNAELKILVDDRRYTTPEFGGRQFFAKYNIPHKVDELNSGTFSLMHAKTMLIDNSLLFIGSQNWNEESIASVGEVSIITRNPQAIAEYKAIFDAKWNQGKWIISP
jgi:phosphatidylserine/phosphatidylglycerophosphate/cardiolipin synthase-like enzyme